MDDDGMFDTYAEMLERLQKLTPEQLQQKPQVVVAGHCDESEPVILQPCFTIGTVSDLFETKKEDGTTARTYVRDCEDGLHKQASVVMLTDISGHEDDSVYHERRKMRSVLKKIAEKKAGTDVSEFARVELEKIEASTDRKKKKLLKECV